MSDACSFDDLRAPKHGVAWATAMLALRPHLPQDRVDAAFDYWSQMLDARDRDMAVPATDFAGHICERCLDAMATRWMPTSDQDELIGVCDTCAQ